MKKFLVLDLDYEFKNYPEIRIYCKDESGKNFLLIDKNFFPYFYLYPKKEKIEEVKKRIENLKIDGINFLKVEEESKIFENKKIDLLKIVFDNPKKVGDVRDRIKDWEETIDTFEYDLSFYKRYILDKKIEPMGWIKAEVKEVENKEFKVEKVLEVKNLEFTDEKKFLDFNILAFDTEFVDEDGESKLIMISIVDNKGFKKVLITHDWEGKPEYVEYLKNEKEMILRFVEIINERDPDFIIGYNSDGFDFPKIREISEKNKIDITIGRDKENLKIVRRGRISSFRCKGRIHIDLYDYISHILAPNLRSEILSLDEVAQELLGIGKKEMKYFEMVEMWSKKLEMERLVEYNLWDAELTLKLAELLLPQIFSISKLSSQIPFDASRYTYSQIVEAYFMKMASFQNILLPNHPKQEEIEKRRALPSYKGAIVIEPKKGIHGNVLVFDFRSLYPTIIITHNIDPSNFNCNHEECKNKNTIPQQKYHFCTLVEGFIPKNLKKLIKERKKIKEEMKNIKKGSEEYKFLENLQYALKIIANATYGYFGYFGARWYKRECGEATAALGRFYITKAVSQAKDFGFEIIYGDTDSLMVKYPKESDIKKLERIGNEFVTKLNKDLPGFIELEFRGLYEGGIFVARERGEIGAKKRYALIDYEGNLEIRGFETVRRDWCELAKKIQRDVLLTILKEKRPERALEIVRKVIEDLKKKKIRLEELIIYEQITKPLSQYKQVSPHLIAAKKLRERGIPIGEGGVVGFVITKGSGSISERAEPYEFVNLENIDVDYYIKHQIVPAALRVLKSLGYKEQDLISGKVQKSLAFFSS